MNGLIVFIVALNIILNQQCACHAINNANSEDSLIIQLPKLGCLRGTTTQTARTNETIYQFLGIKYAESPSGPKRFKVINNWIRVMS